MTATTSLVVGVGVSSATLEPLPCIADIQQVDDAGIIHPRPAPSPHPALVVSLWGNKHLLLLVLVEQLQQRVEANLEIEAVVAVLVVADTPTLPARGRDLAQRIKERRSNKQSKPPLLPVQSKHSEVAKSLDPGLVTRERES